MAVIVTDSEGKQVVDLAASFGARFKVSREAGGETWEKWSVADRVWLLEIRGRHGLVHPYGGDLLCAVSNTGHTGARLRRLPFVLDVRGDEETVIRFHVDHAKEVFEIIRPYRRRRLSAEQRARSIERLAGYAFEKGQSHARQSEKTPLESTQSTGCMESGRVA
jgi:hypothetical protein